MSSESEGGGLDLFGIGQIAKAIPPKVYEQSAETVLRVFENLIAPITETTSGLGRYIRQKFDNMVDVEKAVAAYTIESAIQRSKNKAAANGLILQPPQHIKSFVKTIEEAAKETDPLLHEMWTNLLASQFIKGASHPYFVEILSHFSPLEAELLLSLLPLSEIGESGGSYMVSDFNSFRQWTRKVGDEVHPWTISVTLLIGFNFAGIVSPKGEPEGRFPLLYRTETGTAFLSAVT